MKKIVLALLVFCFAGVAFAQHRGGGYQHGGQRHHGGYGWVAPLFIGAGAAYILTRPVYIAPPPVVYYDEPLPRIMTPVPAPQPATSACHRETRKIFDEKGVSLGEQVLLVCPLPTATPPVVTR